MTYNAWKSRNERNMFGEAVEQPSRDTATAQTDPLEKSDKGTTSHDYIPPDNFSISLGSQTDTPGSLGGGDSCAVCLEAIENDDEIRGLKCGHCYHQTCIDQWLTGFRATCPLCKRDSCIIGSSADETSADEQRYAQDRSSSAGQHILQPPPVAFNNLRVSRGVQFGGPSHHPGNIFPGSSLNQLERRNE